MLRHCIREQVATEGIREATVLSLENYDEDKLEGERESPGDGTIEEGESIGHPIREGEPSNVENHFDDYELPRQLALEVSDCQTGAGAVLMSLPMPATIRPTIIWA